MPELQLRRAHCPYDSLQACVLPNSAEDLVLRGAVKGCALMRLVKSASLASQQQSMQGVTCLLTARLSRCPCFHIAEACRRLPMLCTVSAAPQQQSMQALMLLPHSSCIQTPTLSPTPTDSQ